MDAWTFLFIGLLPFQMAPSWQRKVSAVKDAWVDKAEPHPLSYFTQYPRLREEDGDFCYLCSPEKKLAEAKRDIIPTELHLVGAISGYQVYDLFYHPKCEYCATWKSILVKVGLDSYREIYHIEPGDSASVAEPSEIVKVGAEELLWARFRDGGNKGMYGDDYYWIDKGGVTRLDFGPIYSAALDGVPDGESLWRGGDANGPALVSKGMFKFWVWDGNGLCCSPGAVIVRFRLAQRRVVVTDTTFDPNGGPSDPYRKK